MTMAVGWRTGPDEDDVLDDELLDLARPDPEDLLGPTDVPPAALLLAADPTSMPGQWVDLGMSAWFAHTNEAALQQARWILETSRAQAGTSQRVLDRPRAGKIVAASLGWSEGYASTRIEFAHQVLERLPALGEAMADGRLEEHKASIFTTTLADLDDTQARSVVERVLPLAPRLPFRALRLKIEAEAEAVDDGWAAARRAAAIARRRVSFRIAPSGAAELCGLDLPEDPAQDSYDRIVALGRLVARRLRRAGLDAPKGPIESEVMLTVTGPFGPGMWDTDVIDHVVDRFGGPTDEDGGSDDEDPLGPNDDGPDHDGPDDGGPDDGGPDESGDPDDRGPDLDDQPDDSGSRLDDGGAPAGPADGPARAARTDDQSPADDGLDGAHPDPEASGGPHDRVPWRVPFAPRVALRLGLKTLLGLDRRPGEIPGRGPVVNAVAVSMAWARAHSSFRLLLYDHHGALAHVLSVRPPRTGRSVPHADQRRHHLVEVTAYTSELDALAAALGHEHPDEIPEILQGTAPATSVIPGDALGLLARAARALARARERPADEHPAHTRADAGNRFPSAALRAWVEARDRTCRTPACDADAVTCDIDHTLAVTDGGLTTADGLGAVCRRDHTFKHDPTSGWTVDQPTAGHFTWTSPTGRTHHVDPDPYDPLPGPVPRADGRRASVAGGLYASPPRPRPPGSPRPNRHGHITQASRDTAARLRERARDTNEVHTDDTAPEATPDDRYPEDPPF